MSCVMYYVSMKNDVKLEEELTCVLKNDVSNLPNFDSTLKNLKICTSMGFF